MRRLLIAAGAIAALTARSHRAGTAAARDARGGRTGPAPLRDATALLRRFVDEHKIAGAVAAVARRGKLAYLEAAGFQDIAARTPMTDRSLFRIYSMTKSVTAVAVMMLLEEGRFSLADPVVEVPA